MSTSGLTPAVISASTLTNEVKHDSKSSLFTKPIIKQPQQQQQPQQQLTFKWAEQYMMYKKAETFKDTKSMNKIMNCMTPAQCKSLGRKIEGFVDEEWDKVKFDIVVQGNYYKFSQSPSLKEFLLSTGLRPLVEASKSDKVWGIGMTEAEAKRCKPEDWKGQNLLGKALGKVREMLRSELTSEESKKYDIIHSLEPIFFYTDKFVFSQFYPSTFQGC